MYSLNADSCCLLQECLSSSFRAMLINTKMADDLKNVMLEYETKRTVLTLFMSDKGG